MRHRSLLLRATIALLWMALAVPAFAQTGRVGGMVKDSSGKPIKGATVVAENPQSSPSSFTATTDDKGRFSMIGLRAGQWKITANAPGFAPQSGMVRVQTIGAPNPPIDFTLAPGPTGPAGALAGVNSKELQAELAAAEQIYNAGQYDQAIAAYRAMLAKTPALTMLNLQIGRAYRQKKEYDNALAAYQEVLKGDPNNEKAKIEMGMTNLEKGDFKTAEELLSQAAEGTGASREVFYNLGEVKFAKGEVDEAGKQYQRAVDLDPTWAKPLFKLALIQLNKGNTTECVAILEKVQTIDPNSQEAAQAKALVAQLKK